MLCPRCGNPLTGDPPECLQCASAPATDALSQVSDESWPPGPAASSPYGPNGQAIAAVSRIAPLDDARECARIATIFSLLIVIAPPVFGSLALFYGVRAGLLGAGRRALPPLAIVFVSAIVLTCLVMKVR
jgi:hypothetical protein